MKKISKQEIGGNFALALAALIWGSAFVAQSVGMEHIGPFTFNCVRTILGAVVLIPCIFLMKKITPSPKENHDQRKALLTGGVLCGVILFAASSLQQIGIKYTTAGKAGFITALYIIIVPILGLFAKKRVSVFVWLGVILATVGLYLLCINEGFSIGAGDLYVLICAVVFSLHIIVISHYSPLVNGVKLSCIQFFVAGTLSGIVMFIFETPVAANILRAALPILYAGILSSGVAYTLQIVGQKYVKPAPASLIMSLESVFAAISGWILLNETLSTKELIGCVLMFAAIILAQLPSEVLCGGKARLRTISHKD